MEQNQEEKHFLLIISMCPLVLVILVFILNKISLMLNKVQMAALIDLSNVRDVIIEKKHKGVIAYILYSATAKIYFANILNILL